MLAPEGAVLRFDSSAHVISRPSDYILRDVQVLELVWCVFRPLFCIGFSRTVVRIAVAETRSLETLENGVKQKTNKQKQNKKTTEDTKQT